MSTPENNKISERAAYTANVRCINVPAIANVHWHGRHGRLVRRSLIEKSIEGGADVLLGMPNIGLGLLTGEAVMDYHREGVGLIPDGAKMTFLPTIMLTERTTELTLIKAKAMGVNDGKIYPYLRTTKSENGVKHGGP